MSAQTDLEGILSVLTSSVTELVQSPSFVPSLRRLSDVNGPPPPPAMNPQDVANKVKAIAAASQLVATLQGSLGALELSTAFHKSTCVRLVIDAHVVETIRESGKEEGLHVSEIAKSSNVDPDKLARVLRYLASHYCFRETSPDVFANTTISCGLDTGKSVKELTSSQFVYEGTNGFAALYAHSADEVLKASAFLAEALLDPSNATKGPYEVAHGVGPWPYYAKEENQARLKRFQSAMNGITVMDKMMRSLFHGYPFKNLPEGALIVDCGGGVGSVALEIIQEVPHLKVLVQDLPETISGPSTAFWAKEAPELIESGKAKLMVHDLFTPQPITDAALYFLRVVIHDWPTADAIKILRNLSDAAKVKGVAKLLLIEHAIDYLCPAEKMPKTHEVARIHGPGAIELPQALLPASTGAISPYFMDMQMMSINAQERTISEYRQLGLASGWKLEDVYQGIPGGWVHLVFGLE